MTESRTHRNLAPTVVFRAEETVYGIAYRPENQLAKDICKLGRWATITPEQRDILVTNVGFNFEAVL